MPEDKTEQIQQKDVKIGVVSVSDIKPSSTPPSTPENTEPATLEQMLTLRAKFDSLLHGKKPVTKDGYENLMGEIEKYQQNPYQGNEITENPTTIKNGFLASIRRKLGF